MFTTLHGHPFTCLSPCMFVPLHGHSLLTLHAHCTACSSPCMLIILHPHCIALSPPCMQRIARDDCAVRCMVITLCTLSTLHTHCMAHSSSCTSIAAHLLFSQHIFGSHSRTCNTQSSSRWKKPGENRAAAPALQPRSVHGASPKAVSSPRRCSQED